MTKVVMGGMAAGGGGEAAFGACLTWKNGEFCFVLFF